MKKIFVLLFLFGSEKQVLGQGCVGIRSNGNTCTMNMPQETKSWEFNLNNRYYKSYKHFVGTVEQKNRVDSGTEVINHSYSLDLTITRTFNNRWSLSLTSPVISNSRSSKYEHYGNTSKAQHSRRTTHSFGLGDMRLVAYRWMLNPGKSHKGNFQFGLGLKLPTGEYNSQDYFFKNDSTSVVGPVDQSIQPGDGGLGITVETKGFYNFSHQLGVYADIYYLLNPKEQNGVSTARGNTPGANALKYFTSTMSVPDQFMIRLGANYSIDKISFSGGIRLEGIPSSDLVGGDKGFRRPGYVISAEPVVSYTVKKVSFYASVPVAIQRNRTKSNADKLQTVATGVNVHGDAAFSDYSVNIGCTVKF